MTKTTRLRVQRSRHERKRPGTLSAFAVSFGVTTAIAVASGLFGVISTRALGPYERGLLAAAVAWTSVLFSIAGVGLPQAVTYHVGRVRSGHPRYVTSALILGFAAGVGIAVIGVPAALVLGGHAGSAMSILFAAAPLVLVGGCGIAALLGTQAYRAWGALRFVGPASALLGVIAVVVAGGRTAVAVTIVVAGSWALQAVLVIAFLRRRALLGRFDRDAARDLVAYGWRQLVAGGAWLVTYKLDQLVLSITASPYALGLYAAGATVGEVIVPLAASAGAVMLARVAAAGNAEARASVQLAVGFCVALAGTAALVVFLFAPSVLSVLFGEDFVPAQTILRILILGSVALAVSTVLGDTLRGLGRPLDAAKAEAVGAVCTVILLAALVPSFGTNGAAIASTTSYTVVMLALAAFLWWRLRQSDGDGG
jgi:O-antigen/teichoic acid export membrane protein